mgnify:FL=1
MDSNINNYIKKNKCFIIAEIGLSHEGSLGVAVKMIEKASRCGVDAVKFQTHLAEFESSELEKFRLKNTTQDNSRFDYWKRTSFKKGEWKIIKKTCDENNVCFMSSPFSVQAAELLEEINIPIWKISSGDINNYPLLNYIEKTKKPIFLSSGMSGYDEISNTLDYLKNSRDNILLFQCTNSYPCIPEEIGYGEINNLNKLFKIPIGLSDHSGHPASGIAAYTLGAQAIEVHVTWSKDYFGPDVSSSLTFDELKLMTDSIRFLERGLHVSYSKNKLIESHDEIRNLFMKGIYLSKSLKNGHVLKYEDLSFKKPLSSIPASNYKAIIGQKLKNDLSENHPLSKDDFIGK